jgi:hypothetical protein
MKYYVNEILKVNLRRYVANWLIMKWTLQCSRTSSISLLVYAVNFKNVLLNTWTLEVNLPATCSALSCRLQGSGSQYQAAIGTDMQNIFFKSKRHCLCLPVLLPVGDRLVWIRACGNRTRIFCRVVSCRAVWCESSLKQVLLSCPITDWCRVLLSFHLSLFQGDKRIFDSG